RHTRVSRDWSSDVCSSDLGQTRLSWQPTSKLTLQGRMALPQRTTFEDMQSPKSYMNYGDSRNGDYKMWDKDQLNFDADVLATYTDRKSVVEGDDVDIERRT